jgi:hypothetical protein
VSDIRKRIKDPVPDGWEQLATAMRETGTQIVEAMRDAFGPRQEIRLVTDGVPELIKSVHAFETREERLKREIADRLWELCGGAESDNPTAGDSAENDLAGERAEALMKIIEVVRKSNWPEGYVPLESDATPQQRLQAIRQHLIHLCKERPGEPGEFARASVRADVVLAFVNLARTHPDPKRLLPRGDRLGDWLPPGTPVTLHLGKDGESEYSAVVEPSRDMVTLRLDGSGVVTDFPRELISKEGEPWMPPKPTAS